MEKEIEAIVLWHYHNARGKFTGASTTYFIGTIIDFQDLIKGDEGEKKLARPSYSVPHQIVILSKNWQEP